MKYKWNDVNINVTEKGKTIAISANIFTTFGFKLKKLSYIEIAGYNI